MIDDMNELKRMAKFVILSQGNVYIKELLREHKSALRKQRIRLGSTKAEFEKGLIAAIEKGILTSDHIERWLQEVEGWGQQHAYVFDWPNNKAEAAGLNNIGKVVALAKACGLEELVNKQELLWFPDEDDEEIRKLVAVQCDDEAFRLIWHQGKRSWIRAKPKDRQETEDGDLYEYRAYRERAERSVIRFEWVFANSHATVYLHASIEESEHQLVLNEIWEILDKFLVGTPPLSKIELDPAVARFDSAAPGPVAQSVASEAATYNAPGGYVSFVSTVPDHGYDQVAALNNVRAALDPGDFSNSHGRFLLPKGNQDNLPSRDIKFQIHGKANRIRIWVQCKREDVLHTLTEIIAAATG